MDEAREAGIPVGVAERLLFGTRRGAYSGATEHADGYLVAADGGTLFLDEIAELDLAVQPKLLRVLEDKEVTPLGATRARPVDFRLVVASHSNLRDAVAHGKFREDLYYRVGRPLVMIPPLRERREEIPWLIKRALAASPSASLDAQLDLERDLQRDAGGRDEYIEGVRAFLEKRPADFRRAAAP